MGRVAEEDVGLRRVGLREEPKGPVPYRAPHGSAAWAGVYLKGLRALFTDRAHCSGGPLSALLLGTSAPALTLHMASIPPIRTSRHALSSGLGRTSWELTALLKDVSLEIDGRALMPIVSSAEFPPLNHLATGEGQLHFTFTAALPGLGAGPHRAVFRNNHRIVESAYLAHAFAGGKEVVVLGQTRDALHQELRIDYALDLPLDESGGRTKAVALGLAVLGGLGWVAGLVCRAKP